MTSGSLDCHKKSAVTGTSFRTCIVSFRAASLRLKPTIREWRKSSGGGIIASVRNMNTTVRILYRNRISRKQPADITSILVLSLLFELRFLEPRTCSFDTSPSNKGSENELVRYGGVAGHRYSSQGVR